MIRNWYFQIEIKLGSLGIKCLAEFHDIDAVLTQRRADWRRIGLPAGTCSFVVSVIFLAMIQFLSKRQSPIENRQSLLLFFRKSNFLYIQEVQLHRS